MHEQGHLLMRCCERAQPRPRSQRRECTNKCEGNTTNQTERASHRAHCCAIWQGQPHSSCKPCRGPPQPSLGERTNKQMHNALPLKSSHCCSVLKWACTATACHAAATHTKCNSNGPCRRCTAGGRCACGDAMLPHEPLPLLGVTGHMLPRHAPMHVYGWLWA